MKTLCVLPMLFILLVPLGVYAQESVVPVEAGKGFNYVILDAASWDMDIEKAQERNPGFASLFDLEGADQGLETVAPYIFAYEASSNSSSFSVWLTRQYDPKHKAMYLYSESSLQELRDHLARCVRVRTEEGKSIFFRFYDPAVAPYMLPALTSQQAALFFAKLQYVGYRDLKTEQEVVLGLSEAAQRQAKGTKAKQLEHPLVFSSKQMKSIEHAMQAYSALEYPAVHASLGKRKAVQPIPLPQYDGQSSHRVMVEVVVDNGGKVVKASAVRQGDGIIPSKVQRAAEAAALKTQFAPDADAPAKQTGNIVYHFDKIE